MPATDKKIKNTNKNGFVLLNENQDDFTILDLNKDEEVKDLLQEHHNISNNLDSISLIGVPTIKTFKKLKEENQENGQEAISVPTEQVLEIDTFHPTWQAICKELDNYTNFFKDKVVFCNYNDGFTSNFTRYFINKFNALGLKELITIDFYGYETHLIKSNNGSITTKHLKHNEPLTYNSKIALDLLKTADVVVSMPTQNDFIDYITFLIDYNKEAENNKRFITIGLINNVLNPLLLKFFRTNTIKTGFYYLSGVWFKHKIDVFYESNAYFTLKENKSFNNLVWFTNFYIEKDKELQEVSRNITDYEFFDDTDILAVPSINEIPADYKKAMGVPVGFINYYKANKPYKIIGELSSKYTKDNPYFLAKPIIKEKVKPDRLVIQRVQEEEIIVK